MLLNKIQNRLQNSDFISNATNLIKENQSGLLFYNLNRSAKATILAHIANKTQKNILFVTADDLMAEDYGEDFQLLLGNNNTAFLPDYEVLAYEERSPHYTIRAQRIEALYKAMSNEYGVYSLSIRSLLRKMAAPAVFKNNIIEIAKGEEVDLDELMKKFVNMGFTVENQISQVGEISKRGGILDVFSPNNNTPIRIEFFGDEVDSIRTFNLTTQRSTGKSLKKVTFLPSREFSINDISTNKYIQQKIDEQGFYEGIELDTSLLIPETSSFLHYFNPENTILVWDEYQHFSSYFLEIEEETSELWQKAREKFPRKHLPDPDQVFYQINELKKTALNYQTIYVSTGFQDLPEIIDKYEAPMVSQTVMHSDISILEQSLDDKIQNGYEIYILSDNKSQSKRMRDLLPEIQDKVNFSIGVLQKGFTLQDSRISIFTDHEIFARYKRKRQSAKFSQDKALVDYESLTPGDFIVHIDHGIGVYEGLKRLTLGGNEVDCLTIRYAENDKIYVPTYQLQLITKFVSDEGFQPTVHKIGGKKWEQQKTRAKKQIELVAEDLVKLLAERKLRKGIKHAPDSSWQTEMEEAFLYEDTPDQRRSTEEIKADMEADFPMERLLCGDVGFGKTEIAIRAAFKAVMSGCQVAVLVPTTLLCEQHFLVFKERLAQYPVKIAMLSRFRSKANISRDLVRASRGEIDIVIGTHRLFSKDVKFKQLGLLIVDEEHRFGVRHKNKLRELKANVDTLYMSATPIPRTMNMALSKMKEMSLIQTPPVARLPIRTVVIPHDEEVIKDAIQREVDRGGQVFFVHNRVQTIDTICGDLRRLMPKITFRVGHGQMKEKELESVMLDFSNHKFDVLIATTIIENGIDIPNANTMIVNRSDMFGLAQLYQMRGRVGRSNRRAYAYLIIPSKMQDIARQRLETLTEYNSLGAGYQIAMRDLELRGAGTLLGTKQSGTINSVGFNYYNKLLETAIKNLEEENPNGIWDEEEAPVMKQMSVEADFYFPENYIQDEKTRLSFYKKMLSFEAISEFDDFRKELRDRFGKLPDPAEQAVQFYQIKMLADRSGLASFKQRGVKLILEFDAKNLPNKETIGKIVQKFDYPIAFDMTKNLKLTFTIGDPKKRDKVQENQIVAEVLDFIGSL